MAGKVYKLSVPQLKKLIAEEKAKISDVSSCAKKTKEVEADDFADTLEKDVDHYKGLKETENKLKRQLESVRKKKALLAKRINESRKRSK